MSNSTRLILRLAIWRANANPRPCSRALPVTSAHDPANRSSGWFLLIGLPSRRRERIAHPGEALGEILPEECRPSGRIQIRQGGFEHIYGRGVAFAMRIVRREDEHFRQLRQDRF